MKWLPVRKTVLGIFCALGSAGFLGCGYTLQGSKSSLPPEIKRIAILSSDNQTSETSLSTELSEALRSEFERYGNLELSLIHI